MAPTPEEHTPTPTSAMPDGLLGVVVQHTAELARMDTLIDEVERRLGGVERNQITLSGQLQGNITKTERLEMLMTQFSGQLTALLTAVTALKATAESTHTTLVRWEPTIVQVVPILEERAFDAKVAARSSQWTARIIQRASAVGAGLGVLVTLSTALFAVTKWSGWGPLVTRYPVVPWVYALAALAVVAGVVWVIWRPRLHPLS